MRPTSPVGAAGRTRCGYGLNGGLYGQMCQGYGRGGYGRGEYGRGYGWSSRFPLSALTVTSTGYSNQPTRSDHLSNLSKTSDLIASIDRACGVGGVNSGWRSTVVNAAVGGSPTSEHQTGRAGDLQPSPGKSNRNLATCIYVKRRKWPALDQVIWYTNKSHVHVGWKPSGARGQFKVKSGSYATWVPTPEEMKQYAGWGVAAYLGVGALVLAATAAAAWYVTR